jgi:chromate transporter
VKIQTTLRATLATVLIWGGIWLGPLLLLSFFSAPGAILSEIGWFFSKLAVVTFGGAYAVLAYMGQDVVVAYGWLEAGQMMDGLGLAETTPGPLILVTEFVGYLAAYRHDGGENAWLMGLLGALVTLWATFAPCFLWIFTGAPYIEWINAHPRLKGALAGITAAVVGVILNLTIWFALHVFFATVTLRSAGPFQLWTPDLATLDWRVVLLTAVSGYLLLWRHWGIQTVIAVAAALAVALSFAVG